MKLVKSYIRKFITNNTQPSIHHMVGISANWDVKEGTILAISSIVHDQILEFTNNSKFMYRMQLQAGVVTEEKL